MNTFKLESKEECKEVKWCQLAASKDQARQVLTGLFVDSKKTVAADGFRMHVIETPAALYDYDDQVIKSNTVTVNPQIQEVEVIEGTFPDYTQIVPTDEPVLSIGINKKYLADLKTMPGDEMIILHITDPKHPVKITCPGSDAVAVIMPMHLPDYTKIDKPYVYESDRD